VISSTITLSCLHLPLQTCSEHIGGATTRAGWWRFIGAGSREQLPWRYFGPPWATLAPPETCILCHFWDKNTLLIRRRSFFFYFWDKKTLQFRRRPFFYFFIFFSGERLCLGQKDTPNPAKTFFSFFLENACDKKSLQFQRRSLFRIPDFGALSLALLS